MNDITENFIVPDSMADKVACVTLPQLYTTLALDIDLDDAEWINLSRDEQFERLAAKELAETQAKKACFACPLIAECAEWANKMGQDVFGVVGGTTAEERPNHKNIPYLTDYTERGPLGQVRDDLIERWSKAGLPNRTIAERLGCNVRTVERRKAGLAAGTTIPFNPEATPVKSTVETTRAWTTPISRDDLKVLATNPETAAKIPLLVQRVTSETAAIYDALTDGRFHDRSEVIDTAIGAVDLNQALRTAPSGRKYADEETRIAVGARKFLMNRIDIAIRRGRIQSVTSDNGRVLICLEKETAATWETHRAKTATPVHA